MHGNMKQMSSSSVRVLVNTVSRNANPNKVFEDFNLLFLQQMKEDCQTVKQADPTFRCWSQIFTQFFVKLNIRCF